MKKYGCVNLLSDLMVKSPPETVIDKVLKLPTPFGVLNLEKSIF